MASIVDEERFPLVIASWPSGPLDDAALLQAMHELQRFYGREHVVLHDGVRAGGLNAAQRRLIAQETLAHDAEIRRWVLAAAAVVPSPLTRGMVGMIQWLAPSPCPFRAFGKRGEAEEWLLQALRRRGLWKPPATPWARGM